MALDPYSYPPYRTAAVHAAYRLAKFDPGNEATESAMYAASLAFFDQLRARAEERGLHLIDRLDAQSVAWCITSWDPPETWPPEDRSAFERYRKGVTDETDEEVEYEEPQATTKPSAEGDEPYVDPLIALADELLIVHSELVEIADLLGAKRQVVLYGPPGTGKTFVAMRLAHALAGDPGRVELVQFHPSYAYEDFIEGYRPALHNEMPTFSLMPGPFKRLADRAAADPGREYYLVIDELNRGNIAKVFGELYFLLEYRDESIHLQYSNEPFQLPKNIRLIGTMNTADRSIALLDAALRRRFAFVPFFPDRAPVAGLLLRWLTRHRSDMAWVADVVDRANALLNDRNTAIGPSYFMQKDLTELRLARIWTHEILPLLEDHFSDAPERLDEFALKRLRSIPGTFEIEAPGAEPEPAATPQPLEPVIDDPAAPA